VERGNEEAFRTLRSFSVVEYLKKSVMYPFILDPVKTKSPM
jgi:hypothetical protein